MTVNRYFVIIKTYRLVGLLGGICILTKDNITITAMRLFLLNGYKNVSLVDVAKEAGITKGGIYHYFDSKESLLQAAVHHLLDRFEAKYSDLFGGSGSLKAILSSIIVDREFELFLERLLDIKQGDYRDNHASLALEVIHTFPGFQERLDRNHLKLLQELEQKVKTAQEKAEVRSDIETHTLAIIVLSVMSGQNVLCSSLNDSDMRRKVMDNLWLLIKA